MKTEVHKISIRMPKEAWDIIYAKLGNTLALKDYITDKLRELLKD